jgi:nucleotide-binding universal stress UspA family protein
MFQPRLILFPTDFSDCSGYAAAVATDLARQNDARVIVFHVVESLGPERVTFREAVSEPQPESHRQHLAEELRRMVPLTGPRVEYLLAEGDPAVEIERIAGQRRCDLIVMGTHGRTGLQRLLMGSVAEHVVRRAPCPLLIVRTAPTQENPQGLPEP